MKEPSLVSSVIQKFNLKNEHAYMPPLEEIGHYQPKRTPEPPLELTTFRRLSGLARLRQGKDFFSQEFIDNYMKEKWSNESYNRDCLLRMYDLLAQNPEISKQICAKLSQFKSVIMSQDNTFFVLRVDFDKLNFGTTEEDW